MELVSHGTLSTAGEDSVPLGTYASYVLDGEGQPILRLREQAVHTANILRNPRCSLFVQPEDMPARLLARATLIGRVRCNLGSLDLEPASLLRLLPRKYAKSCAAVYDVRSFEDY